MWRASRATLSTHTPPSAADAQASEPKIYDDPWYHVRKDMGIVDESREEYTKVGGLGRDGSHMSTGGNCGRGLVVCGTHNAVQVHSRTADSRHVPNTVRLAAA